MPLVAYVYSEPDFYINIPIHAKQHVYSFSGGRIMYKSFPYTAAKNKIAPPPKIS